MKKLYKTVFKPIQSASYLLAIVLASFVFVLGCSSSSSDKKSSSENYDDGSKFSNDGTARMFVNENFVWEGDLDEYQHAHGNGTVTFTDSNRKYVGDVKNGQLTGYGKLYENDKLKYVGNWDNGKFNGKGKVYLLEATYEGNFVNGIFEGYGKLYFPDGKIVYEGMFSNNEYSGYGTLYDNDGSISRQGTFEFGKFTHEQRAIQVSNDVGHRIVSDVYNGGQNIVASLVSVRLDKDDNFMSMIIDLSFDGDWVSSNKYMCRIAIDKERESVDFISENETSKYWRGFKSVVNAAIFATEVYDMFNNE